MADGDDNNIAFFRGGKMVTYKQRRDELAKQRKIALTKSPPSSGKTQSILAKADELAKDTEDQLNIFRRGLKADWAKSEQEIALEKKFPKTRKGLLKMLEADDSVLPSSSDPVK